MVADRRGDLYYIRENEKCAEAVVRSSCSELLRWHERLGHLNARDLMKLVRDGVVPKVTTENANELLSRCEVCIKGKMTALPFPKDRLPCKEKLRIIHSDLVGPFRMESLGRAKYFVTFIDDSTRWCEVYFLKRKCGVFDAFKMYQASVEKHTGCKIKYLQSDKYLRCQGIARRLTIPRTPQQNGVAERMNRTLMDMSRCLLLQSGMAASFWSEAVATACHIRNRCPTSSLNGRIPYNEWTGKNAKVDYLKVFGSKVLVLDKHPSKDKLAQRSVEGIFVGYPRENKGVRVWLPNMRQIIVARDVKFLEEPVKIACDKTRVIDECYSNQRRPKKRVMNIRFLNLLLIQ